MPDPKPHRRTAWRRALRIAVPGIALALIAGVVAFVLWRRGVDEAESAWIRRVEALRTAGEACTPKELDARVRVPEADNMASILLDVRTQYEAAFTDDDWPDPTALVTIDDEDYYRPDRMEFTEEGRARIEAAWPVLEPLFERLADATKKPQFAVRDTKNRGWLIAAVQEARRLLDLRALWMPEEAGPCLREGLRIACVWKPANAIDVLVRWGLIRTAACRLREFLGADRLDLPTRLSASLDTLLAQAEASVLEDYATGLRGGRVDVIHATDFATGRVQDPLLQEWAGDHPDRSALSRGRVIRRGLQALDVIDASFPATRSVEALRTLPVPADVEGVPLPSVLRQCALQTLAVARLARVGLALYDERAARRPLPRTLDALADRFPDGVPLDPYVGGPFRYVRRDEGVWLAADPTVVDPKLAPDGTDAPTAAGRDSALLEEGLAWEIPGPRQRK